MLFKILTSTIKNSGKETDKGNFKCAMLLLITNNKKKLYFEENIAVNKKNPK